MAGKGRPAYLGVDVGSVSTNFVLLEDEGSSVSVVWKEYLRTQGAPLVALKSGLSLLRDAGEWDIKGVGTTGSGRELASAILGADVVKNEITAHATAALSCDPEVATILEIGGQDSKLIILRDGVVVDFAMNTVCAAGTGSFLDQQANRLGIPIQELGDLALRSTNPARIAGRCTVFAESDLVHKQQLGIAVPDLLAGLCAAMVRNFLSGLAKGKELRPKVFFQGGVAANAGMRRAFEQALGQSVIVPEHFDVMGAFGAALLARRAMAGSGGKTRFAGIDQVLNGQVNTKTYECRGCSNACEISEVRRDGAFLASWGARCGKQNQVGQASQQKLG